MLITYKKQLEISLQRFNFSIGKFNHYLLSFIIKEIFFNKKDPLGMIIIGGMSIVTYSLVFFEKNQIPIYATMIIFCIGSFFWLAIVTQQLDNLKKLTMLIISPFNKMWLVKINIIFLLPLLINILLYVILKNITFT
jgi:hypothetical protein